MRARPIKRNDPHTTAGVVETETERLTGENIRLTAEIARLDAENSRLAHENERVARSAENEERQTLDRHNAQDASNALRYCAALEDTVAVLEKDGSRARADLAGAKERLQMTEEERMQLRSENVRLMGELSSVKEELRLSKTEGLEKLERSEISTKENLSALTVEEIRTTKTENTAVPLALDICSAEGLVAAARGGGLAVRKQISEMEAKLVSERQRNVMLEDEKTRIREGLLQIVEYCKPAGDAVYILWCTLVEEFETLRREHNRLSSSKYDDLKTVTKEKSKLEEENQRLRHKINRLLNLPL